MGGNSSKPRVNLVGEYHSRGIVKDPRFGQCPLYEHMRTGGHAIVITHQVDSLESFHSAWEERQRNQVHNHQNILRILGMDTEKVHEILGIKFNVRLLVEYHERDLGSEISRRRIAQEYYSEEELWYILLALVSAGAHLHRNKIFHGDIKPLNILVTSEGRLKVADQGLLVPGKTGYSRVLLDRGTALLAPSQMDDLKAERQRQSGPGWKTDVYSVGMTLLEAATLEDTSRVCYNWTRHKINNSVIDDLLHEAGGHYSSNLIETIRRMLTDSDEARPDFESLRAALEPHSQQVEKYKHQPSYDPMNIPMTESRVYQPRPMPAFAIQNNGFIWLQNRDPMTFSRYVNYLNGVRNRVYAGRYISPMERDELNRASDPGYLGPLDPLNQEEEYRRILYHLDIYAR